LLLYPKREKKKEKAGESAFTCLLGTMEREGNLLNSPYCKRRDIKKKKKTTLRRTPKALGSGRGHLHCPEKKKKVLSTPSTRKQIALRQQRRRKIVA